MSNMKNIFKLLKNIVYTPHTRKKKKIHFVTFTFKMTLLDAGRKLNVHKTFRRRLGRPLNVLCTFNLRSVSTEKA